MLKLAAFLGVGGWGWGIVWDSFFRGGWHITEKSSYRAPKKLPWACQDGVSLRQKLLPACHMHREMCDFSMYCVHRRHLIKAHRWIRGDTQLSGMQTPVLPFPAIWTWFIKRALGEGWAWLHLLPRPDCVLGYLMPGPRWHICLVKCKPTPLSLLGPPDDGCGGRDKPWKPSYYGL